VAGVQIKLPPVAVSRNDAHTFKPYNPAESIGSQTPALPYIAPPPSQHCNTLAMIVIVAVVIVATVFTAGAALTAMAPEMAASAAATAGATAGTLGATMAAGAAAITGGVGLSGAVAAAAFAGGVAGSVAGQLTGKALGVQEHFSLREAFATGLTTAATAGISNAVGGGKTAAELAKLGEYGKVAATGVASYGAGYAADRIAGLDAHFSWAGVAASAIASVASSKLSSEELGALHLDANSVTGDFVQGFTGDVVGVHARRKFGFDDRIDYGAMATDAFGNALGNEIAGVHAYRKGVQEQFEQRIAQMTPQEQIAFDMAMEKGANEEQALAAAEQFSRLTDRPLDAKHPTFSVQSAPGDGYSSEQIDAFWDVVGQTAGSDGFASAFVNAKEVANLVPIRDRVDVLGDMLAEMNPTDPNYAGLKQLHDVMTDALLAKDVYYDHSIPGLLPEGITRIESPEELQKLYLTPAMLNDPKSGYFAAVYRNDATGGY
ncbi:MAG TPA: hypothetical protein VF194_09125, partial [Ferrovibrio sp.]|uniref:hypothetical protein n=1 Tax=Ferrovibrio sp. TaxID=1917215 RepID=UPI002ED103B8